MNRKLLRSTMTAWAFALASGCSLGSTAASPSETDSESKPADAPSVSARPAIYRSGGSADSLFQRLPDVAEVAVKSVVNISSTKVVRQDQGPRGPFFDDPFFRRFFGPRGRGMPEERRARSLGSGVIVDAKEGIVLTNNHVVQDASDIKVALSDDREYDAEMVGTDPSSDLAVIRLENPPEDLEHLSFGDSGALRLGEPVLAIGNPFGVGQTVTMGIVSATGRANVGIVDYEDFIQTDAAINPGNSGGALVNLRGELVGINTAILSRSGGYQGIGFAIPSNMARVLMTDLMDDGAVSRGFLGVIIQDLTPKLARVFGIDRTSGVVVSDVLEDGPADRAGLEPGDVILSVDGKTVDSAARLRLVIAQKGGGQKVRIAALRNGKERTFQVTLTEKEREGQSPSGPEAPAEFGMQLAPLGPETRRAFRIDEAVQSGVVVTRVLRGSRAAEAGLRRGDVIVEVAREPVDDPDTVERMLQQGQGDVLVRVVRRNNSLFLVLERG
ncbi:MAG TPA: Do family serine endopeptidase [Myxococcales bacterium LLY-WYZ-16_1]|nr:Do family serine endopeptidase [Myxococcales bacterium LLY-WYZ-16_1]